MKVRLEGSEIDMVGEKEEVRKAGIESIEMAWNLESSRIFLESVILVKVYHDIVRIYGCYMLLELIWVHPNRIVTEVVSMSSTSNKAGKTSKWGKSCNLWRVDEVMYVFSDFLMN